MAELTATRPGVAPFSSRRRKSTLPTVFWTGAGVLVLVLALTAHPQYGESVLAAALIICSALLPCWLWITGRVPGLPLFPMFALTNLGTFAFPLLYEHPIVSLFPPDNQLTGGITVSAFLIVGTFFWQQVGRRPARPLRRCLVLNPARADLFFLATLAFGTAVNAAENGSWFQIAPEVFTIVRAVAVAMEALGCFVLGFRLGSGALSPQKRIIFKILLAALLLSTLPGLLLVNAMSIVVIGTLGFTLGARRFPWITALLALLVFVFLHAGKGDMREVYWKEDEDPIIQPSAYPSFLAQWATISAGNIAHGKTQEGEESQSLLERASLMQLLLYVEAMTPNEVSYMNGETYALIPGLLVPRIINPQKLTSHEGTYLLNIHYGFQTREATAHTTIGFGLLNESFANFGYVGVALLAVFLGAYYGAVARWARVAPVLSFRSLFAIIVASYAFQSEFSASVYVTAMFQSTCALVAVAALFMSKADCAAGGRSSFE